MSGGTQKTKEDGQGVSVRLYTMTTQEARGLDTSLLWEMMPQRMEKAQRFRFENGRLLSIAAGYLMIRGLGLQNEAPLALTKEGKPYAEGYPAFNVSHSGEMAIMAVAENSADADTECEESVCGQAKESAVRNGIRLGVDIEQINDRSLNVARRAFSGREIEWMHSAGPESEIHARFFRLWTLKEAVMKAAGLGMSLDPQSFEVMGFLEGKPVTAAGRTWYAQSLEYNDYMISVCCSEPFSLSFLTGGALNWTD